LITGYSRTNTTTIGRILRINNSTNPTPNIATPYPVL
jgi:hypothetical protein